ncbi:ABC transporter permease subunit [Paenibacillus sp. GCM10023252]|uniref:ABC transporter permease subunit n=1 Tax=Paenibacillus sp. GCM10023252 TaxID=3252649 RepID=UPI0036088E0E
MAAPGLILLFCFSYLPMFGIIVAFKNYQFDKGILGSEWVGFSNFEFLFGSADAWRITYNTLFLNALFIVCGTLFSILLALLLNEVGSKLWGSFFQSTFFFPYILSWVIVGYFAVAFLQDKGFVNSFLSVFGLQGVSWYNHAELWPALLVVISIWKGAGYGSIMYLAGMMGISNEYYESARIDGANKLQQIAYITLPLIRPLIIILTLLSIGKIFYADFGMFYNLTNFGNLFSTTDVIDTYVFRALRVTGDVGMASAAGFYQAVVGFILVLASNLLVRRLDPDSALF